MKGAGTRCHQHKLTPTDIFHADPLFEASSGPRFDQPDLLLFKCVNNTVSYPPGHSANAPTRTRKHPIALPGSHSPRVWGWLGNRGLENVLHGELHDSWIACRGDSAKQRAGERSCWVVWQNVVQNVKGFGTGLDVLVFPNPKISNHG